MHMLSKLYLTVDGNGTANLWVNRPSYFSEEKRRDRPGTPMISGGKALGYPPLKKYAISLELGPGPDGILEVTMDIRPAQ